MITIKKPDGTTQQYDYEQLRQDFIEGKVSADCLARGSDDEDYKPVTDFIYSQPPPKKRTSPIVVLVVGGFIVWLFFFHNWTGYDSGTNRSGPLLILAAIGLPLVVIAIMRSMKKR